MSYITILDNALWIKHLEGDPQAVARILALPQNAPVMLVIEGTPVRFVRMRDGADGRPTPGLRPADPAAKRFWDATQQRRGETVRVDILRRWGAGQSAARLAFRPTGRVGEPGRRRRL